MHTCCRFTMDRRQEWRICLLNKNYAGLCIVLTKIDTDSSTRKEAVHLRRMWMVIMVAAIIGLVQVSTAMAALNPPGDSTEERWYTVDEAEDPFVEGGVLYSDYWHEQTWQGEYYVNDQTFFTVSHDTDVTGFRGSYLWESGFFLGVEYTDIHGMDTRLWGISPGYRLDLKRGYIAFSADFGGQNQTVPTGEQEIDQSLNGLAFSWFFYPKNMKLQTDLKWRQIDASATEFMGEVASMERDDLTLDQRVNYKIKDDLVVGFRYAYIDHRQEMIQGGDMLRQSQYNYQYQLGFTWEPKYFIINAAIGRQKGQNGETIDAALFLPIWDRFKLGLGYSHISDHEYGFDYDDESKFYSFKYNLKNDSAFCLSYHAEAETWELMYHHDL